jgi:hypothetical protein
MAPRFPCMSDISKSLQYLDLLSMRVIKFYDFFDSSHMRRQGLRQ